MAATNRRARWRVRPATLADAEAIRAVAASAWRDTYAGLLQSATIEGFIERAYSLDHVERRINQHDVLVVGAQRVADGGAESPTIGRDEHVVAFADAVAGPHRLDLVAIYALPEVRGRGAGSLLLHALQSRYPSLPIAADVLAGNRKGEVFYERRGFTPGEVLEADLLGEQIVERRWWLPARVRSGSEGEVGSTDQAEPD
jgi:GNAT superfamily N-acetyltransferase